MRFIIERNIRTAVYTLIEWETLGARTRDMVCYSANTRTHGRNRKSTHVLSIINWISLYIFRRDGVKKTRALKLLIFNLVALVSNATTIAVFRSSKQSRAGHLDRVCTMSMEYTLPVKLAVKYDIASN